MLVVSGKGYVPVRVVPGLEDYDEHRNIIQYTTVAENTIQRVFYASKFKAIRVC